MVYIYLLLIPFGLPWDWELRLPHFCYPHTTYCTNIASTHILLHFSQLQAHDIYFHSSTEIDSSCDNVYNFPVAGNFHQVSTFRHANPWLINESFFGEEQAKMHCKVWNWALMVFLTYQNDFKLLKFWEWEQFCRSESCSH